MLSILPLGPSQLSNRCASREESGLEALSEDAGQPGAQRVKERIGRGMQEQVEGVGPEAMVTEAVGLQGVLEVLDEVLGLPAVDMEVVDGQGASRRLVTTKRLAWTLPGRRMAVMSWPVSPS